MPNPILQIIARMHITNLELAFLGIVSLGVFAYAAVLFKSWRKGALLAILSLPGLFLAVTFTSQFLMIDAITKMEETTEMLHIDLQSWRSGYRTTYAFMALIVRYRSLVAPQLPNLYLQNLIKLAHWMVGIGLLGWIHFLLHRHFLNRGRKDVFFLIYLYTSLLLPTNATALKFYNYDLLSLLFAVVALLYTVLGIQHRNWRTAILSVVTATLATQEKMVAAPVLVLSLLALAYVAAKHEERPGALHWSLPLLGGALLGALITIGVGAISYGIVAFARTEPMPIGFADSVLGPFISLSTLIYRFTLGQSGSRVFLARALFFVLSMLAIGMAGGTILLVEKRLTERSKLVSRIPLVLHYATLVVTISVLIIGVVGTFGLTVYEAPFHRIPSGYYVPDTGFNGTTEHFGAQTLVGHWLAYSASGYSDFVTSAPTIFWVMLGISLLLTSRKQETSNLIILKVLVLLGLLMPLGYAASGVPLNPRYLNIPLFVLVLGIVVLFVEHIASLTVSKQFVATFGVIALLLAELLPFAPLFGPFRPAWDWFHYRPDDRPAKGVLVGSWQSYGAEVGVAANMLEYYCLHPDTNEIASQIDCGSVTLYFHYPGRWLRESPVLKAAQTGLTPPAQISPQDLILYSRREIQRRVRLPREIEPVMRVEYMGLTDAWVFHISDLQSAGIPLP